MELLRPLTLSTADTYRHAALLLPETRIAVSLSKSRRLSPSYLPRLSTRASHSSASHSLLSQPPKPSAPATNRWVVLMEKPPISASSKSGVIDYYVETLARVVGSERDAQMCIYDASWESSFGFCCDIDEESSRELACIPGVLSVRPDNSPVSGKRDYSRLNLLPVDHSKSDLNAPRFSPCKDNEYWLVRIEKPGVETVTKAQMVDYYARIITKVLRNEKDAEASIYHISWETDLGFCCHIDEECAKELSDVPGVLSVRPDFSFGSEYKNYEGSNGPLKSSGALDLSEASPPDVKTKRLFVTVLTIGGSRLSVPIGDPAPARFSFDGTKKKSRYRLQLQLVRPSAGERKSSALNREQDPSLANSSASPHHHPQARKKGSSFVSELFHVNKTPSLGFATKQVEIQQLVTERREGDDADFLRHNLVPDMHGRMKQEGEFYFGLK